MRLLECTANLSVSGRDQSWAMHWHQQDLWVQRSTALGVSRIVTDHDLVSPAEQKTSGFYQEWLRALGIYHMIGAVFPGGDGVLGVLGVHRPQQAGAYTDDDRRRVALLLPHLQRALWLGQTLSAATIRQRAADSLLERIDAAVFVVDRGCRLVTLNTRGEQQLRGADGLMQRRDRLVLAEAALNARLLRLVDAAVATAAGRALPAEAALAIPRDGRLPLTLLVTPLQAGGITPCSSTPLALVVVRDPEAVAPAVSGLCELFGFTHTEAAVAASLASGHSVARIAAYRGVSTATVRSHVKAILLKTGTHRLAEAVALIVRSTAGFSGP